MKRSAVETAARETDAAVLVSSPCTSVAPSSLDTEANVITVCSAPLLVPPSSSNAARAASPETSCAHWRRASLSKEWASSITQWRMGGRIFPSAATLRSSSEWLVTTTSPLAARRRAPWTRHSLGKYGQRVRRHSLGVVVSICRGTYRQRIPSASRSPSGDWQAYAYVTAIAVSMSPAMALSERPSLRASSSGRSSTAARSSRCRHG